MIQTMKAEMSALLEMEQGRRPFTRWRTADSPSRNGAEQTVLHEMGQSRCLNKFYIQKNDI